MSITEFHPVVADQTFIQVILPLAVVGSYTYLVPEELAPSIKIGIRVEVQFGRTKRYAGIVSSLEPGTKELRNVKPILTILDALPIVDERQIKLWTWISNYYCCSIGEVMNAAIPGGLRLASETTVVISPFFDGKYEDLDDKEYMIAEALSIQNEIKLSDVRKILNQKSVQLIIQRLLEKRMIYLKEELKGGFKPKTVNCLRLAEPYFSNPKEMKTAFEKLGRSDRQVEAMMALIDLSKKQANVTFQDIYKRANCDSTVIRAMEKKGIVERYKQEISRLTILEKNQQVNFELSDQQSRAFKEIDSVFEKKSVCLLHGITGSGKTEIYIEQIKQSIKAGNQCLYLLPEIGLTAQILNRLSKVFGDQMIVYHSRLNDSERVESWKKVKEGVPLILGVRSALFLPYKKLDLLIIDEEHDSSFKQHDPAPRYNGRDLGIYIGTQHKANILLGSATPSIESYQNARDGKYGLVELMERYSQVEMPSIEIIDLEKARKKKQMKSFFSEALITALEKTLAAGQQAILFKNRRGFAPSLVCTVCEWRKQCKNCDVSLTYHKFNHSLRCHYCGSQEQIPQACQSCGNQTLEIKGYGTEKIEDELKVFLPEARIGRMDLDTVRGKNSFAELIHSFGTGQLDILVGTQMVTKGLDFENVGLVGVLSADQLLYYPDFRAAERAYQLITQVSGRAGRRKKVGRVLIQTFQPTHPVLKDVLNQEYSTFFFRELAERKAFQYPPFFKLIKITLKHKDPNLLNEAAKLFVKPLIDKFGNRVKGPAIPGIPRLRNQYILTVLLKLEKNNALVNNAKKLILWTKGNLISKKGFGGIRVNIDVDPYS